MLHKHQHRLLSVQQARSVSAAVSVAPLGHRLGAIVHVKFEENSVLQLVNHRETQTEFIGDFFVKQSLRQAAHHVMFSFGQANDLPSG